ncbi:hypothetical protein WJX82_004897 [Trebouxia sp. C0006]
MKSHVSSASVISSPSDVVTRRLLTRAPFGPKRCHRSKVLTSCSSQLDQQLEGPTLVADAASRLSAAPEHTIHGLVASTSASTEQSPHLTSEAAHQADSIVPHLTEQLASEQSIGGAQQIVPSLPGHELSQSDPTWESLPPHFGTEAAARTGQQILNTANDQIQKITGGQRLALPSLPNLAPATYTAEGAHAGVSNPFSEAFHAVSAPFSNLSTAIASQLTTAGASTSPEPHYGTHAAQAAVAELSQWVNNQLGRGSVSSQPSESTFQSALDSLQQSMNGLQAGGNVKKASELLLQAASSLEDFGVSLQAQLNNLLPSTPAMPSYELTNFGNLQSAEFGGYSATTIALISAAVAVAVIASYPRSSWGMPDPRDTLPWEWNADSVAGYWARRPVAVARRTVAVTFAGFSIGLALLIDKATGKLEINSPRRAIQVRKAIEQLGPAYVKVAQAVSTRGDVLDMNYLLEIERLQDRVPPFPTKAALLVMAKAFGQPVDEVFSSLSTVPVASASLGQVYKGRLRDIYGGGEVAVKVQRPSVQASVALDLLLMRRFAAFCQTFPQIRTNWVGLIDEWATRFFHELDYEREAQNGMTFKEQMAGLDGIVVADVYQHLSNKEVLTTVWMQGEKLSESTAGDVRELCTTLLNCYLIQLLETGFLHADPHPGNLIRTPEGQICILDFGLMTEVTPKQSLALVEYIAHLSVEDWNGIARDLRKLGFVPADAPEMAELGLIAPLGNILSQLSQGGGAKGINIDAVTIALDELSKDYPIDIPPYFALILRAFSVIEGTALRVDPDYAIVKETFPYLSRRLLTDNQPRARAALRQLLYGDKARLDITRLQRLSSGFGSFTTSGIRSASPALTAPALDDTSREVLKIVFNRNGSYLQELLVDELVAGADAIGREAVSEVCRVILGTPPALATFGTLQALGPLRLVLAPFPTPFEVLYSLQPAVAPNDEDQEALLTVRGIWSILQPNFRWQLEGDQRQRVWEEIYPLLPELLPGLSLIAEMFARQLLARVALRAAEELQRPPRRYDQPSGSIQAAGPQQRYNMTAPDSTDATSF